MGMEGTSQVHNQNSAHTSSLVGFQGSSSFLESTCPEPRFCLPSQPSAVPHHIDTIRELGEERTLGKEVESVCPKRRGAGMEETHKEPRRIPGIHQNHRFIRSTCSGAAGHPTALATVL